MGCRLLSKTLPYLPPGRAQSRSANVSSTESLCGTTGDLYSLSVVFALCLGHVIWLTPAHHESCRGPSPHLNIHSLINCNMLQFDPSIRHFQHIIPFMKQSIWKQENMKIIVWNSYTVMLDFSYLANQCNLSMQVSNMNSQRVCLRKRC